MASFTVLNNNFVSGELSPMMDGRLDSAKYQTGLAVCENFIPTRLGGLVKREGTKYIGTLTGITHARLALFDAGSAGRWIVEFTPLKVRFWTEDGNLVQDGGTDFEITTAYTAAQLNEISCVMNKSIMYIVHKDHKPATLKIGSTAPFELTDITFTGDRTFNAAGDYPSCQAFKGGRWYLAATDNEPNAIFASRTPDPSAGDRYNDFTFSDPSTGDVLPTHAIYLQESDMHGSRINWLINQKRILAGAGSSIWMDSGVIATPASFDMSITLSGGCNATHPKAIDNYVIYAGPGGRSLNIISYNTDNDGYVKAEISQTASHMVAAGIKDFIITAMQDTILFVLMQDGTLASCTLDVESGVIGWARHPLGKGSDGNEMTIQSIELVPGDDEQPDVIWLTALRSGQIYIETMKIPRPDVSGSSIYLDCHKQLDFDPATDTVTVAHLANEKVDAVGDNALLPVSTADGTGSITYDRTFSHIDIGYPIEARLRLLRPELPANGTSQGKLRQVESQVIRIYKSLGGRIGVEYGESMRRILPLVAGEYELGSTYDLFTGDKETDIPSYANADGRTWIVSREPWPFNLLSVMTKYGLLEG